MALPFPPDKELFSSLVGCLCCEKRDSWGGPVGETGPTWEDNTPWPVADCLRSVSWSTDSYMAYSQSGLRDFRIRLQPFCLQSESWQFPEAPYCPPVLASLESWE